MSNRYAEGEIPSSLVDHKRHRTIHRQAPSDADMPMPSTVPDVQRFLGMATYLGEFIPDLSKVSEPLRKLTRRVPFVADKELREAFIRAKQVVANSLQNLAYHRTSPDVGCYGCEL